MRTYISIFRCIIIIFLLVLLYKCKIDQKDRIKCLKLKDNIFCTEFDSVGKKLFEYYKDDDNRLNGEFTRYFSNGRIKSKSNYYQGKKEGFEVSYNNNGYIIKKAYCSDGNINGKVEYFSNQKLVKEQYCIDNIIVWETLLDSNKIKGIYVASILDSVFLENNIIEMNYRTKVLKGFSYDDIRFNFIVRTKRDTIVNKLIYRDSILNIKTDIGVFDTNKLIVETFTYYRKVPKGSLLDIAETLDTIVIDSNLVRIKSGNFLKKTSFLE